MNTKTYYEFVNSQTGNVIAHLTLASASDKKDHKKKLEAKKVHLATTHKLNLNLIYWQDKDHPIG
ncbi:MAG: hypothetical protein JWR50_423 [Mucilaginibacter sp.]|nr:hypothetical protein [Mucilaginibacter sp.]